MAARQSYLYSLWNSPKIRKAQDAGYNFCMEVLLVNPELLMILWKKQSEILPRTVPNTIPVILNQKYLMFPKEFFSHE